jgi:hypothetical protein
MAVHLFRSRVHDRVLTWKHFTDEFDRYILGGPPAIWVALEPTPLRLFSGLI